MNYKINIFSLFSFLLIISISSCASNESTIQNEAEILTENTKLTESTTETETEKPKESKKIIESKTSSESFVSEESANSKTVKKQVQTNVTLNWPWRGITIVSHGKDNITSTDVEKLASYGVNLIRLRLSFRELMRQENISFETAYKKTNDWAHELIKSCERNNIDVLISHSDFPVDHTKKFNQSSSEFWRNPKELSKALLTIASIVETFDSYQAVKAFEFLAEPVIQNGTKSIVPENWLSFFQQIIAETRKKSNKYIVFSPGPWGKTAGYANFKKPFSDTKIIYNFHYYEPHAYTHQHIKGNNKTYNYPGVINLRNWNKEKIKDRIKIFTNWKQKHQVSYGFVGEFSVVRWADDKEEYLKDVLDLLEKYNLGYAYFAYNGWKGWNYNYEHDNSGNFKAKNLVFSNKETATLSLLKTYWIKNKNK